VSVICSSRTWSSAVDLILGRDDRPYVGRKGEAITGFGVRVDPLPASG